MMLKAIARAEAQLQLAAELFGQLDQMRNTAVGVTIVLNAEEQGWLLWHPCNVARGLRPDWS